MRPWAFDRRQDDQRSLDTSGRRIRREDQGARDQIRRCQRKVLWEAGDHESNNEPFRNQRIRPSFASGMAGARSIVLAIQFARLLRALLYVLVPLRFELFIV